eukprot:4872768-Pyramimonas_sp.AAC.1
MAAKTSTGDPLLVELGSGRLQEQAGRTLVNIVPHIPFDPVLPQLRALTSMLATMGNLVARLSVYQEYPTALYKLSQSFNPPQWSRECLAFFSVDEERLDVGFSLPLRQKADAAGSSRRAADYLMSPGVQAHVDNCLRNGCATTLSVERKH